MVKRTVKVHALRMEGSMSEIWALFFFCIANFQTHVEPALFTRESSNQEQTWISPKNQGDFLGWISLVFPSILKAEVVCMRLSDLEFTQT